MGNAAARARRPLRLLRLEERGITLIETIVALVLFAVVATALISTLSSAISANSFSRQKTAGEHIVNDQVEWIRAKDYSDVGTTSGNPAGLVASTGLKCPDPGGTGVVAQCDANPVDFRGVTANVSTDIRYVDDPAPTSYATRRTTRRSPSP